MLDMLDPHALPRAAARDLARLLHDLVAQLLQLVLRGLWGWLGFAVSGNRRGFVVRAGSPASTAANHRGV